MTFANRLTETRKTAAFGGLELWPWQHAALIGETGRCLICKRRGHHPVHGGSGRALARLRKARGLATGRRAR